MSFHRKRYLTYRSANSGAPKTLDCSRNTPSACKRLKAIGASNRPQAFAIGTPQSGGTGGCGAAVRSVRSGVRGPIKARPPRAS